MRVPALLAAAALLGLPSWLPGENRLQVTDQEIAAAGRGRLVTVFADNDFKVLGFSLGINYNQRALLVTEVIPDGTLAEVADFFSGTIDVEDGLLGYGCVFSFSGREDRVLQPGVGQPIARLRVDVLATSGNLTEVRFESVLLEPNPGQSYVVRNLFTDETGSSVYPALQSGFLTIVTDERPAIVSLLDNSGQEGKVFRVVGDFLDRPGLTVKVCDVEAPFVLEADGRTLLVTAPPCATLGYVTVEVCTEEGCAAEEAGFRYVLPVTEFIRGNANSDATLDISDAATVLAVLFHGNRGPLCRDALDANDSGAVDLSDAVFILNFLFQQMRVIPPPYPEPGVDPTPDSLPDC